MSESLIADTAFIDFFGLKLISGRKEDLGLPNKLFITRELAEIFFPGENALDKEIFLKQYRRTKKRQYRLLFNCRHCQILTR